MELEEKQKTFLKNRRRLTHFWPLVGSLLLLGISALLVWLFLKNPLLINPYKVIDSLDSGTIEYSTLILMATFLPLMFLMCFLLLTAMVIFTFSFIANEKKYLKIIDFLMQHQSNESSD